MLRKQLYIDEDLNDGLRVLAGRTGKSEAEHVRIALRDVRLSYADAVAEHRRVDAVFALDHDFRIMGFTLEP